MATTFVRATFSKSSNIGTFIGKCGHGLSPKQNVTAIQIATLRATYGEPFGYEKPYPYQEKKLNMITEWFEGTKKRFNENTKVIIVEGNVAVGKNSFGEQLAKNFDMRFYPTVQPDRVYIQHGSAFDLRTMNDILPESARWYDLNDFYTCTDPKNGRIGKMQMFWIDKKMENYLSALLHMLSTGQGVVIAGSPYSDNVYQEAMREMGYITPNFHHWIKEYFQDTICDLPPPHVALYLNCPIPTIQERIKQRNAPNEATSPHLNADYLTALDKHFKTTFLKKMRVTGETLEIDWSTVGDDLDISTIAEEMESLQLDNVDNELSQFRDWRWYTEDEYAWMRRTFSRPHRIRKSLFNRNLPTDCPEIVVADNDAFIYQDRHWTHPAIKHNPKYWGKKPYFIEAFGD